MSRFKPFMSLAPGARRLPLAGFYFLYFASVGIILPFLPAYLRSLSLSATQVGVLLGLSPAISLLAPHLWGHIADRTGRAARVLTALTLGAALAFSLVATSRTFPALVATMALYACFASSFTPLMDTLTLHHVARTGDSFARVRLFGSVGFIVSTVLFGLFAPGVGPAVVRVPLLLLSALVPWSLLLKDTTAPDRGLHPLAGLRLLRHADMRWLLAGTCLHWMACAPFHGTFSIHVMELGLSTTVVGLVAGLGVLAEVGVMAFYPRLTEARTPRQVLTFAFAASAVRWGGMALTSTAGGLVALAPLHGLTFGAFYVASVAFLTRRVPPELRASGQALFAAVTFGLGGLVGYMSSGAGYDWLGGHRLFAVAAVLEVAAAVFVSRAVSAPAREQGLSTEATG
ncbi:MFS transporter [Myxococcus sp. K15C18031901]|uniref:MFS transporter n=1 Tax=Myxococcus dinghuensis TaxID=2906761 RepID=UPI0020A753F7|nr:MFS transporter [Myxococcus dinghuensis]MCP3101233.1 MFS transporter [Myxococcus dinghuensis]